MLLLFCSVPQVVHGDSFKMPISGAQFLVVETEDQVKMSIASEKATTVDAFLIEAPSRLVVDVFAEVKINSSVVRVDSPFFSQVRLGRHSDKVRFVFDILPGERLTLSGASTQAQKQHSIAVVRTLAVSKPPTETAPEMPSEEVRPVVSGVSLDEVQPVPVETLLPPNTDLSLVLEDTVKRKMVHPPVTVVSEKVLPALSNVALESPSWLPVRLIPRDAHTQTDEELSEPEQFAGSEEITEISKDSELSQEELVTARILDRKSQSEKVAEGLLDQAMDGNDPGLDDLPPVDVQSLLSDGQNVSRFDILDQALLLFVGFLLFVLLVHRRRIQHSKQRLYVPPVMQSVMPESGDCYTILGCSKDSSNEDIKNRYKHLLKIYHRDGLESQNIPEEVRRLSEEHLRKVHQAYQEVRQERRF